MIGRVDNKRKRSAKPSQTWSQATKKARTDPITPIPCYIQLGNEHVRYYFSNKNKAKKYRDGITALFPDYDIKISKVKPSENHNNPGVYFRVSLPPALFDLKFGEEAYKKLVEIDRLMQRHQSTSTIQLTPSLWSEEFANQAALLNCSEDNANFLAFSAGNMDPDSFRIFLEKLSAEICNQATFLNGRIYGINTIQLIFHLQPIHILTAFAERLKPEVFIKAMLQQSHFYDTPLLEEIGIKHEKEPAWLKLLSMITQYHEEIKKISAEIPHLKSLEIYDGGSSSDTWSPITKSVIGFAPSVKKRKAEYSLPQAMNTVKTRKIDDNSNYLDKLTQLGWKFLRVQGRTIILQDKTGCQLAVKIQKEKEQANELRQEYNTTYYLRQHAEELGLKSDLPLPIMITELSGVLEWLQPHLTPGEFIDFKKMVNNFDIYTAYVYKIDPTNCDYFTYLHDIRLSHTAFEAANEKSVHDLFTLLAQGVVFPQLADIFHNSEHVNDRNDKGRYMVLVNLLREGGIGSGRLTGWKKAVEYPNLRGSGIADLGDRISLNSFIGNGRRAKDFYSETLKMYGDKAANYLLGNVMAEYQYILFLIAGRRGCELEEKIKQSGIPTQEIDAEIRYLWYSLALQIISNCAHAVSILTHQPRSEAQAFLSSIVDTDTLARQMQYWMTTEYISDIKNNVIPADIYGENVPVSVAHELFRENTFNDQLGFSIDGVNQDLGPVNGQEPIKEANKLFYWMVSSVFHSYNQIQLTLKDVKAITAEKDFEKSEALRKKSFFHLPSKPYHAIQRTLCKERLAQKQPLPEDAKIALKSEAKEHKRSHAAITILNFWRKHKNEGQKKETCRVEDESSQHYKSKCN